MKDNSGTFKVTFEFTHETGKRTYQIVLRTGQRRLLKKILLPDGALVHVEEWTFENGRPTPLSMWVSYDMRAMIGEGLAFLSKHLQAYIAREVTPRAGRAKWMCDCGICGTAIMIEPEFHDETLKNRYILIADDCPYGPGEGRKLLAHIEDGSFDIYHGLIEIED